MKAARAALITNTRAELEAQIKALWASGGEARPAPLRIMPVLYGDRSAANIESVAESPAPREARPEGKRGDTGSFAARQRALEGPAIRAALSMINQSQQAAPTHLRMQAILDDLRREQQQEVRGLERKYAARRRQIEHDREFARLSASQARKLLDAEERAYREHRRNLEAANVREVANVRRLALTDSRTALSPIAASIGSPANGGVQNEAVTGQPRGYAQQASDALFSQAQKQAADIMEQAAQSGDRARMADANRRASALLDAARRTKDVADAQAAGTTLPENGGADNSRAQGSQPTAVAALFDYLKRGGSVRNLGKEGALPGGATSPDGLPAGAESGNPPPESAPQTMNVTANAPTVSVTSGGNYRVEITIPPFEIPGQNRARAMFA